MKKSFLMITTASLLTVTAIFGVVQTQSAQAQTGGTAQTNSADLMKELEALKRLLPDQAHGMADVDYHFANLWFAAHNANWPLAEFYLGETRSHLNWVVRMRPVRRLAAGGELDLRPVLQGVESSGLSDIKASINKRDLSAFEAAYRGTMMQCYGCHAASEKPYLRLRIPEAPATRMIDRQGKAN
ncbi:MAG: hypothetical protein NT123_25200 [Proteobacteria bacterium]|nr:hypothetical protein [Pseudomonadota bacterium]